jgi:hypothetical protein
LSALLFAFSANADIFRFSDVAGYEKCLRTDHLAERTNTASGAQARWLNAADVQIRCVESAANFLAGKKDVGLMKEFVKTTMRGTAHENAIDIVAPLVKASLAECNDLEIYKIILKTLSRPKSDSTASYFQKGRKVTLACLKDKQFKQDFLEEKDSSDSYLSANACEILLEQKLVPSCKKEG